MNLARRLAPILKVKQIASQAWDFVNLTGSSWSILDSGQTARLNSGGTSVWQIIDTNSNKRSASSGKYYFEVLVSKYNVGDSQALRIGIGTESRFLLFMPRGTLTVSTALIPYMESGTGSLSVSLWGLDDVMGCSIEPSGDGNTNVRFYINGVDVGLSGNPYKLSGVEAYSIVARGYRNNSTRDIELKNQNLKYLPSGFEPW